MQNLEATQRHLKEEGIDGWLLYDFRGTNPVYHRVIPGLTHITRRAWLWIPAHGAGEPVLLHSVIDGPAYKNVSVKRRTFVGWRDMLGLLREIVSPGMRVAMDYSPGNALPIVSWADAGSVDLVRGLGAEVVSSADVAQTAVAAWGEAAVKAHAVASCKVAGVKDAAFGMIRERLAKGAAVHEHEVAAMIREGFSREGLEWPDGPIVAVNAHSGDPHYEPPASGSARINKGDWVLIDLWARQKGDENTYSDITWVGCCGTPTARHKEVFNTVKAARDASLAAAQEAWKAKRPVQGWELDEAARGKIIGAGFEGAIKHRTGHSLSPGPKVHGLGMNLDNLETRDTRRMLAGTGFTIEPGIYLPEFGVRLEINVYVDAAKGPVVTSCVQSEPVVMG